MPQELVSPPLDDYATHLPVLRALCADLKPRKVLEFGAGLHSTPFFLSLPYLEQLVSVEWDAYWRQRVQEQCEDPRLTLTDTPPKPKGFDLVFIDDGKTAEERKKTIGWVLDRPHPPVVIHDAEVLEYAHAMQASLSPATAVLLP